MKSTLSILVAASTLAVLAACGGGGDGGGAPGAGQTAQSVAITSTNQSAVTRASLNGGTAVALAQGSLAGGGASGPLATSALLQRAIAAATNQRRGVASAGVHPAAAATSTSSCDSGGSLTITLDDRDGNLQVSNGDVLTAAFAQCRDSATSSINGSVVITLTAAPSDTTLDATASFQNLAVVDGTVSSSISGNVSLHEVHSSMLSSVQLSVGSGGLAVTVASSAYNDSVSFESGMVFTASQPGDGSQTAVSLNGSFTATSIGGRVTVSTLAPLTTVSGAAYPGAGEIRIVGASGSTVLATVLDTTQVQLQLDANGDGTYETTTDVAWTTLLP